MSLFLQGENRNVACTSPLEQHSAAVPPCCTTRSNAKPSLAQHAHPTQHQAIAQDKASSPTPSHQGAPATRESSTAQLDPGTPSATQLWKVVQEQNRRALRVARSTLCSGSQGVSSSHVTRSSAVRLGSSWPGWLGTAGDRWGPLGIAGDRWGSLGTAGDAGDESFVTEFTYGKFIN